MAKVMHKLQNMCASTKKKYKIVKNMHNYF